LYNYQCIAFVCIKKGDHLTDILLSNKLDIRKYDNDMEAYSKTRKLCDCKRISL